jgi:hypothetical protein
MLDVVAVYAADGALHAAHHNEGMSSLTGEIVPGWRHDFINRCPGSPLNRLDSIRNWPSDWAQVMVTQDTGGGIKF